MLDELHGFCAFSKIDLKHKYYEIHMWLEGKLETMFKTSHGLYAWLVIMLGLTNTRSNFMTLMNHVLLAYIGKFIVIYFNYIHMYRKA